MLSYTVRTEQREITIILNKQVNKIHYKLYFVKFTYYEDNIIDNTF